MINPYSTIPDYCFWSRSMTRPAPGQIDPCVEGRQISDRDKVATMGSCFAQHLGRFIAKSGLCYYVSESGPDIMTAEEKKRRNYGVFSARYGNVYTVKQLVQLFDRAFGGFIPLDSAWDKGDRVVDPFRPLVEPDGFADEVELLADRASHLTHVRQIFLESDYLIFTLGLTEGWRSKRDGAVYPMAPGVSGGDFNPLKHEFVNFTARETEHDLADFIERVKSVNPRAQIILTVSPVPLIATYEARHAWVSTTYSKAALRVAADAAERSFRNVIYFPSYEIITSPSAQGRYYEDDLRQVTDTGVKHVMRVFAKHFLQPASASAHFEDKKMHLATLRTDAGVVCDEEVIEKNLTSPNIA